MSKINLPLGATGVKVVVQPVVLFSICDAFIRRGDGQSRVIGTLLGTIEAGVIDLRLSYAVPHIETPESVSCAPAHASWSAAGSAAGICWHACQPCSACQQTLAFMQVSIDIPHHRTLFDLHQKVNSKEVVVGW